MFDKKRCIDNIYYLAKEKNIKIGDLERNAGVSAGYLSRLNKEDNSTNPGIEFLDAVARELEISLDALICYDYVSITPTELYVLKVIDKLIHQTQYEERSWKKTSLHDLQEVTIDCNGNPNHPLFKVVEESTLTDLGVSRDNVVEYNSMFMPNAFIQLTGDGFYTDMPGGRMAYLMCVTNLPFKDTDGIDDIFELYLVKGYHTEPVCFSGDSCSAISSPFHSALKDLYMTVVDSQKRTQINSEVKYVLDAFLEGVEIEDLPF